MSDLGAIFHVKKAGVQYNAHAYTTIDECPYPNLKIKFKGQQAYIKLEDKGSGDVPCYVKTRWGSTYQVRKQAVPTGQFIINAYDAQFNAQIFIVPRGITRVRIKSPDGRIFRYVGVTPNSTHHLMTSRDPDSDVYQLICDNHSRLWVQRYQDTHAFVLEWSPEINKHPPDVNDY